MVFSEIIRKNNQNYINVICVCWIVDNMKIGLIKDESAKFDGQNWHDIYAEYFKDMNVSTVFLDSKKSTFIDNVVLSSCDAYLWRVWHVPEDRIDATRKILFLEEEYGFNMFPSYHMLKTYDDKVSELFFMEKHNYLHPPTLFTRDYFEALDYSKDCKLPIISKAYDGASGDNIRLIKDRGKLIQHVDKAFSEAGIKTHFDGKVQKNYVFLQEYIPCDKDMKIIVIGDEVALSYWRQGTRWKHNITNGGKICLDPIPEEAKKMAIQITKDLNYNWCGLDFIQQNNNIYLIEFDSMFAITPRFINLYGSIDAGMMKKQCELIFNKVKK